MKIASIQAALPQTYHEADADGREKKWRTAIFKETIAGPAWAGALGLRGDGQADRRVHGGPDKALNAYCLAHYPHWTKVLGLAAMPHGAFGENLTLADCSEADACIGDIFNVGGAVLQISQPRQPCGTLARRWKTPSIVRQIEENGMSGWYFRVLQEGELNAGDDLKLTQRPHAKWTVREANEVMNRRRADYAAARELAALPELAESWKEPLLRRAANKE